jgi:quercetin dioxygenase-like cupin family protein
MAKRITRRVALVAGAVAGLGGSRWSPASGRIAAQDASCEADALPPDVATARAERTTFEPIAVGAPLSTPGHTLTVNRFTLPPGEVVSPHRHPGATVLSIEAGEMGYTVLRGTATLQSAQFGGDPMPVGVETIMRPGDAVFYDAETAHTARNSGDQPVVVLAVTLLATDQPATIPTDEHGNIE